MEKIKKHSVEITIEPIEDNLFVKARETQISQVILNILNNGVDAIASQENKWIKIAAHEAENYIEIRITDSGKGIPSNIKEKIFQPFFTTKAIGAGTGMGLSISHGIVNSHNGKLFVDDASPNTCFVIQLQKSAIINRTEAV